MKKILLFITFILLTLFSFEACDTDNLELTDPNSVNTNLADYPSTADELKAGVNAVYGPLQSHGMYSRWLQYVYDNMGQENEKYGNLSSSLNDFIEFTISPTNENVYYLWKNCYNGIFRANTLLDHIDNIQALDLTAAEKNQKIGEVKFLRAHYYFLLVSRFGDVPLHTTVSGSSLGRSSKESVYDLIVSDLESAASLLLDNANTDEGRITMGAANAMLGKVQLYRENYAAAKVAFDKVITSGEYSLTTTYFDNFTGETEFNSESVFEVLFIPAGSNGGFSWAAAGDSDIGRDQSAFKAPEYGMKGWHNVNPSTSLLNEFEATDPRYADSFYSDGDSYGAGGASTVGSAELGDDLHPAWRKYMLTYKQGADLDYYNFSDINFRVLRYADVILMAAEVENELGNLSDAIDLMNEVRTRVGMDNYGTAAMNATYPVSSKAEFFTALVHERRVELAGELTRFPDLVRWDLASSNLTNFTAGKNELLPIPQKEIDTNDQLTNADQNSGY